MMAGQGTTQIAILGAIGKGFKSLDELAVHLPINRSEISKAASKLIEKYLIERIERGRFHLTQEGRIFLSKGCSITSGPNKPRHILAKQPANTLRQRAWNAMRLQGRFTVPSICMVAKTAEDKAPEHNLQTYFRLLLNAYYLVELGPREKGTAETSNGFKVYRLIKNTGPLAPVWSKGNMIDRNEQTEGSHDLSAA